MTEMEKTIIKKFIDDMILLFCRRYVDDTWKIVTLAKLNIIYAQAQRKEYACSEKESAIYNRINYCSYYGYIQNLFRFNNDSFWIKH